MLICLQGSHQESASIVTTSGLSPNKQQAIIRTNDDLDYSRIHASPVFDMLVAST